MNKQEFLAKLQKGLAGMPQDETAERLTFYSEMVDDYIEEGMTEENAVAELGSVEGIVVQIMSEIPLTKLLKEKVKPKRALRAWEIVLLALGSPVWLSLIIAFIAVIVALYAVIWSIIISLWAIELSVVCCSIGAVFSAIVIAVQGNILSGVAILGAGFVCAGLAIYGFFGCKYAVKIILALTKRIFMWIKGLFIKKEAVK